MAGISQIGQYRIEALLGSGEWTETFHAYDIVLRRPVALKLIRPTMLSAGKKTSDFLAAAQQASELVHPRIAWVWSTGELENRPYIVERFIGGEPIARLISRDGPLPWDRAIRILEQIAQAIEFAEERQWVHGRVTPHNILISLDHGAVLCEYGLQNAIRQVLPQASITPYDAHYLAPEVLQKQKVTSRADQYALACTLVEMLSGKNPFKASSVEEILLSKTTEFVRPLLPVEILPPQAVKIIEQALHAEPSARYANSLDFVSALDRAIRVGLSDAAARRQHEETLRRWREEEESGRKEAEETARLAALDQARQEIHERAHLEAEKAIKLQSTDTPDEGTPINHQPAEAGIQIDPQLISDGRGAALPNPRPTRARRPSRQRASRRLVLIGLAILLLSAGVFWTIKEQSNQLAPAGTPTNVSTAIPALQTDTPSAIPSLTPTQQSPTATSTFKPSPTPSHTATKTSSPTHTLVPTTTETPRPFIPTATRGRPERNNRSGSG